MTPEVVPITAARNVPYFEEFALTESGSPIDLTGCTAKLQVRLYGNAPSAALIDLANVTADETEGVWIKDAANGLVKPWIAAATLAALPGANAPDQAGADAIFVYDLVLTWPDGVKETFMEGSFVLKPGVTR